jgi:ABC-2 type transport system permease protein
MVDRVLTGAWVFLASMRMQARAMRSSQPAVMVSLVQPTVLLLLVGGVQHPTEHSATAAVVGVFLTSLWASTIWSAGGILRREVGQGTLAATLSGVRSPYLVLSGKCLGATLVTGAAIAASTVAGALLLRLPVRLDNPGWLAAGVAVVVFSGTGLGMILTSLFLLTRHGPQLSSALMYPVFILGGLLIPLGVLPVWLRWMALLLSFRWAREFMVGAATGSVRLRTLGVAATLGVGYLLVARVAFARVLHRGRGRGTLELV